MTKLLLNPPKLQELRNYNKDNGGLCGSRFGGLL